MSEYTFPHVWTVIIRNCEEYTSCHICWFDNTVVVIKEETDNVEEFFLIFSI